MSLESENTPVSLAEILAAMRASQELMRKHGESALKQAFKEFFDACPEIQGVYWEQYAPYFNDGEPCVFSVNEPKLVPNKSLLAEDLAEVNGPVRPKKMSTVEVSYCRARRGRMSKTT